MKGFFIQGVAFIYIFLILGCCFKKKCFSLKNNLLVKKREKITCPEEKIPATPPRPRYQMVQAPHS